MKENVLFFSGYSNFFSWNLRKICRWLGKKLGTFLNAAKYLCRRTICHLLPEKLLFISLLWARNLSDSEKNFSEKVLRYLFFVCRGHFVTFYQRFQLFLDLSLNVWASAEQFSTKFLKVHLRCGSVFLEPDIFFLSKVGQKVAVVSSKQLKTSAEEQFGIFSQRKCFFVSLLWAENFQTLRKTSPKSTQFFIFCEQKKNLEVSFKWKVPLVKYFERKTSRVWSKLLREKSQVFIFRVQMTLWLFSRRFRTGTDFWTVSLNFRVPAEKFSTVFSKVHSRWGRQRTCFFWIPQNFPQNKSIFIEVWANKFRLFSQNS